MEHPPPSGPDSYRDPTRAETSPKQVARGRHPAVVVIPAVVGLLIVAGVFSLLLMGRGSSPAGAGATGTVTASLKEEPKVGSLAPDFELKDIATGEMVKLSSLRGRPVWINFWATWCPPCREEMPEMEKIYSEYKDRNLAILGVDVQESEQAVKEFTRSLELTWTFMIDPNGAITDRYFVGGLPSHYFVDREGVIQAVHVGGLTNMSGTRKIDPRDYLKKIVGP